MVGLQGLEDNAWLPTGGVYQIGPVVQRHQQPAGLLQHVAQGHEGKHPAVWFQLNHCRSPKGVGEQVAVGQHYTLGLSGSAGGKHKLHNVVRGRRRILLPGSGLFHEFFQFFEEQSIEVFARQLSSGRARDDGQLGTGPIHDASDEVRSAPHVQRHRHYAGPCTPQEGYYPFGAVGTPDDCLVALDKAFLLQDRAYPRGQVPQPAVAPFTLADPHGDT